MFSSLRGNIFVRKMTAKSGRKKEESDEMERRSSIRQSTFPFLTFFNPGTFLAPTRGARILCLQNVVAIRFQWEATSIYVREHVWIRKISSWHPFAV